MTRAAIYCRVSSGRHEQEATVESQREAVRAYATEKGYTIVDEFVDEAYSGAALERPGLDRLRDTAREGAIDRVLVLSPAWHVRSATSSSSSKNCRRSASPSSSSKANRQTPPKGNSF